MLPIALVPCPTCRQPRRYRSRTFSCGSGGCEITDEVMTCGCQITHAQWDEWLTEAGFTPFFGCGSTEHLLRNEEHKRLCRPDLPPVSPPRGPAKPPPRRKHRLPVAPIRTDARAA